MLALMCGKSAQFGPITFHDSYLAEIRDPADDLAQTAGAHLRLELFVALFRPLLREIGSLSTGRHRKIILLRNFSRGGNSGQTPV